MHRHWLVGLIAFILVLLTAAAPTALLAHQLPVLTKSEGKLARINCGAWSFTLATPKGTAHFRATPMTLIYAGSHRLRDFCQVTAYRGVQTVLWWSQTGGMKIIGRMELVVLPAQGVVPSADPLDRKTGDSGAAPGSGPALPTRPGNGHGGRFHHTGPPGQHH